MRADVYAAVMVLQVIINLPTSPATIWFIRPPTGWGFAVALYGVGVLLLTDRTALIDTLTEHELRPSSSNTARVTRR